MFSFLICLALLIGGYFVYGGIVEKTFGPDDRETPAVKINDGVGPGYFMLFFPAELVIALLEAFIYRAALRGRSKRRAFLCGLCANVCSAALGFFLAEPVWQFVVSIS